MSDVALAMDIIARDKASKTFDTVGGKADKTGKKLGGLGNAAKAGMAVAAVALVGFAKGSVEAFKESEEAQKRLGYAFEKFPRLADSSQASLQKLNSSLQKKTKYDDDAIASGQAVVAQFGVTGKQLEQVTPLLLDYASTTGKDLPSAGQDLGKALLGNAKALKNVGIKYTATGDTAKDFANITGLLQAKVGGFADKEATTAAGKAAILGNQFGELQETVGKKLIPILTKAIDVGLKVVDWIDRNSAVIGPLVVGIGTVLALVKAWTIGQAALNFVLAANPIGLVVIGIAALAAGLIYAYKHSETFRNTVKGAFDVIGTAASFMWNSVLKPVFKLWLNTWFTVIGALVNGAASAFGWVPGIGGKLKEAAKKFNQFRDDVNRSLDGVKDKTINIRLAAGGNGQVVQGRGGKFLVDASPTSGRVAGKVIPAAASGGIVRASRGGTLVQVGEGGQDEAIVPLPRGGRVGSGGDTIVINVTSLDPLGAGRAVEQALMKLEQTRGTPIQIRTKAA